MKKHDIKQELKSTNAQFNIETDPEKKQALWNRILKLSQTYLEFDKPLNRMVKTDGK